MRQAVRSYFPKFTEDFEGRCAYLYLDYEGLVTTGEGNLVDPIEGALGLPWIKPGIGPASEADVRAEWTRVKSAQAHDRGPLAYWKNTARIYLSEPDIDALVWSVLGKLETALLSVPAFHSFASWPADAQLGLLSMGWAMGVTRIVEEFPHFQAACSDRRFLTAANESHMDDATNPGLKPRNAANFILFTNADRVAQRGLDPEPLYYPKITLA